MGQEKYESIPTYILIEFIENVPGEHLVGRKNNQPDLDSVPEERFAMFRQTDFSAFIYNFFIITKRHKMSPMTHGIS
jgi:hypothetical protein